MDIEISPAGVILCADAVAAAAGLLSSPESVSGGGNDGFTLSSAITRFATELQETTAQASRETKATAEDLEVSAILLRRADEDAATTAQSLWSRAL